MITTAMRHNGSNGQRATTSVSLIAPHSVLSARFSLLIAFVFSLLASVAFAGGPGSTTGDLLKIPVGGRAIGMGEAYAALANDSSAMTWNPAGLVSVRRKEASFMHSDLIEGVHYEHLSYLMPGEAFSYGASMAYLGYGNIAGYDASGNSIGNQRAYSFVMSGGLAQQAWEHLSIGISMDILHQALANESASTVAMNAGTKYELPYHQWDGNYTVAFSMLHLGPGLKFIDDRSPLPRKFKLGAAATNIKEKPVAFTFDINIPNDNSVYVAMGAEYTFKKILALRMGYIGSNDEGRGLRMGIGINWKDYTFDYAYGGFGDFGATHRFGLSFHFGDTVEPLNREQRSILKEARVAQKQGDYIMAMEHYRHLTEAYPDNEYLARQMVFAHDSMTHKEQDLANMNKPKIPSVEEAALMDLVPEGAPVAKALDAKYGPNGVVDYLGETTMPDATSIDALFMSSTPEEVDNKNKNVKASIIGNEPLSARKDSAAAAAFNGDSSPVVQPVPTTKQTANSGKPLQKVDAKVAPKASVVNGAALSPADIYE